MSNLTKILGIIILILLALVGYVLTARPAWSKTILAKMGIVAPAPAVSPTATR